MHGDETRADDAFIISQAKQVQEEEELIDLEIFNHSATSQDTSTNHFRRNRSAEDGCKKISNIYLFSLCWSPVLFLIDIGTDIYLAYQYYIHEEYLYFKITIGFVAVPAIISTIFSVRMYALDDERVPKWRWTLRYMLLTLQISPVMRYLEAFHHALVLKRYRDPSAKYNKHSALLLKEDSNLALLRILECFLEAAPQQVVQITILLTPGRPDMPPILQFYLYVCLFFSFVSTSWTLATYHRSIRFAQADKAKMKWIATFVQFLWIFSIMISRILTISEAAAIDPHNTAYVCLIHWWLMNYWLFLCEKSWFCFSPDDPNSTINSIGEHLFHCVMAMIYVFSFVAINDKPTRYKYLFYYSVCLLENLASMFVWFAYDDRIPLKIEPAFRFLLPLIVFSVFAFGVVMMVVYYIFFHPSMSYEADDVLSRRRVALCPTVMKKTDFGCVTRT